MKSIAGKGWVSLLEIDIAARLSLENSVKLLVVESVGLSIRVPWWLVKGKALFAPLQ